jgi:hypothetical protein
MIELFDANGKKLASGYIVPDGGKLRVPMTMADAAPADIAAMTKAAMSDSGKSTIARGHKPGYLADDDLSAAQAEANQAAEVARAERKKSLSSAWQNPALDLSGPLNTGGSGNANNFIANQSTVKTGKAPSAGTSGDSASDAADARDARLRDAWR